MPSLRELLNEHGRLLVLDAASTRVQVGFLEGGELKARWATATTEAGTALFTGLEELQVKLAAVRAFVFCEGPGSILGIRTAAMAIRTWNVIEPRPAYAYSSLALFALGLPAGAVGIADARRDSWHCYSNSAGLTRSAEPPRGAPLYTPAEFRHWSPIPAGTTPRPYDVPALFAAADRGNEDLFRPAPEPEAFMHEMPTYATWSGQIHRAPVREPAPTRTPPRT